MYCQTVSSASIFVVMLFLFLLSNGAFLLFLFIPVLNAFINYQCPSFISYLDTHILLQVQKCSIFLVSPIEAVFLVSRNNNMSFAFFLPLRKVEKEYFLFRNLLDFFVSALSVN